MSIKLKLYKGLHWIFQNVLPAYYKWKLPACMSVGPLVYVDRLLGTVGLVALIVHRSILEMENLIPAPEDPIPNGKEKPYSPPLFRSDDGFGTDFEHPTTSMSNTAPGRNMDTVPKEMRNHLGEPHVQLVAQRLLARESFKPAGDQLNIIAAAWIQLMVHDWIGHMDGDETSLDKGGGLCPMRSIREKFKFFDTKERPDGHFNSERSMWWDASFLYGQNEHQNSLCRTKSGGRLKVNSSYPGTLARGKDGLDLIGDQRNSWVGVSVLQELFVREHNYIADRIAECHGDYDDEIIFGLTRNCIAAIVAKIHTVDWTVELLKTTQLYVGMRTNWMGLTKAIFGDWAPLRPLSKIGKKKADNKGVPFVLTEEFAAVYRLHPLSPPGLIIEGDDENDPPSFVNLADTLTSKGRGLMQSSRGMAKKVMKSCFHWPCGHLMSSNYPNAFRDVAVTDADGRSKSEEWNVDLAAVDLYRDRERGILPYNEFRRKLHLKPFKSYRDMLDKTSKTFEEDLRKLEAVYGPDGIENVDLLVGDMYEKKITSGFALSETSFIVFLLMASRRLDADPFLNELLDEEHYTQFGLDHIGKTTGLLDVLERHYPDVAKEFRDEKQSAFKPLKSGQDWDDAAESGLIPRSLTNMWEATKRENKMWVDKVLAERNEEIGEGNEDVLLVNRKVWYGAI